MILFLAAARTNLFLSHKYQYKFQRLKFIVLNHYGILACAIIDINYENRLSLGSF